MDTVTLYDKIVAHFGGPSKAAVALNITPTVIGNWRSRGVPTKRALQIEAATGGKITAMEVLAETTSETKGRAAA